MVRRTLFFVLLLFVGIAPTVWGESGPASKPKEGSKEDYYELYQLLADTIDQVDRNYVKQVDRRELIEAAIKGVMNKLDPYSTYITPEEVEQFRTSVENEFGGIGIQVSMDDGDLRVLSPIYGTPAYRAGIVAGDRIVEIDGKSTDGITLDEAILRMKGKEGASVTLGILHANKRTREKITLKRERIRVETVLGDRRNPDDTWNFLLDPRERIGYIRVTAFSRETAHEMQKALEQLKTKKFRALILDLRFNPGGLLSSAIEVSGLFVSQGRIVSTKGRNTPERVWDAHKEGVFEGFPMVVLVNHYSASASEIVAACLQDHKRAVIIGERTWGKGSVQNVIELEEGHSALKLTTAAYHRPSGKNIHRFTDAKESDEWGVMPDTGHDVRLSEMEVSRLLSDRRDRDILQPHTPTATAEKPVDKPKPEANGNPPKVDSPKKDDPPKKDDSPKTSDTPKPNEPAKTSQPASKPEPKAGGLPNPAAPAETVAAAKQPFVDRQMEAAVKYLSTELARAK